MKERKALPCDACGEGTLHPQAGWSEVEYKGRKGKIQHCHSVCDACGADLADAEEMRLNRREWRRFRKEVDIIPLGKEIAAMRKTHALTQEQAGRLFGGGPVAFSKYENDDLVPDEAMANLLYMAIRHPEVVRWLAERKSGALTGVVLEDMGGDSIVLNVVPEAFQEWRVEGSPPSSAWTDVATLFRGAGEPVIRQEKIYSFDYSKGAKKWVLQKPH